MSEEKKDPKPKKTDGELQEEISEEHGNLGATEDDVSPVTAPEIVDEQDETTEETLDELKDDITGG